MPTRPCPGWLPLLLLAAVAAGCPNDRTGIDGDQDSEPPFENDSEAFADPDSEPPETADREPEAPPDGDREPDGTVTETDDWADGTEAEPDPDPEPTGDPDADPEPDREATLLDQLDQLDLYINLGDSIGAGYNAVNLNRPGGFGYSRLLLDNQPMYDGYREHCLAHLFPSVRYFDLAEGGAKSDDVLERLRQALLFPLPWSSPGDVLVTVSAGGNDFKADLETMLLPARAREKAEEVRANLREIFRLLAQRYGAPDQGRRLVLLALTIPDPTGGTGAVPDEFDDDFCETIHNPLLIPVRGVVLDNLALFNRAITETVAEFGGQTLDIHELFLTHGMNAGALRWIDDDCVHPVSEGHHQIRRLAWRALDGEWH